MQYLPGRRFGPYEVTGELGHGGMAAVLRAIDTRLHREVALKVLLPSNNMPGLRERFLREARAASSLSHPNICTIFDIGEDSDDPYMVLELLEGETLKETLAQASLPVDAILDITTQTAHALVAAHARGIIHRDIKPANIFLVPRPEEKPLVKVLDFGLAKLEDATRTHSQGLTGVGATVGTVSYMSPEQARGDALDARSDLFSLGIVMYEMATGAMPFRGVTSALVFVELLGKDPRPVREWNKNVPNELATVIHTLLSKEKNARYQSARSLLLALDEIKLKLEREKNAASEKRRDRKSSFASQSQQHVVSTSDSAVRVERASIDAIPEGDVNDPLPSAQVKRLRAASSAHRSTFAPKEEGLEEETARRGNHGKIAFGVTATVVLLLLLAASSYLLFARRGHRISLPPGQSIQITAIENRTGNEDLDQVCEEGLGLLLAQSSRLNIRGESEFLRVLASQSVPQSIDQSTARRIAQQMRAKFYLYGYLAESSSKHYTLSVTVSKVENDDLLVSEEVHLASLKELSIALEKITNALRADLGDGDSIASHSYLQDITASPSLLKLFHAASYSHATGDVLGEAHDLQKALAMSPESELARMQLAWLQLDLGATLSAQQTLKALPPANDMGDKKLLLQFLQSLAAGDAAAAVDVARSWSTQRPYDAVALIAESIALRRQGRFAEAEQSAQKALLLNPANNDAILEVERSMLAENRYDSLLQTEDRGAQLGTQHPGMVLLAAYALGRTQQEHDAEQLASISLSRVRDKEEEAVYLDNKGQLTAGAAAWHAVVDATASESSLQEVAPLQLAKASLNRALMADCTAAKRFYSDSKEERTAPSFETLALRGIGATLCGDAEAIAQMPQQIAAVASSAKTALVPEWQAALLLHASKPDDALSVLSTVRGASLLSISAFLRADAHIQQHHPATAIADLQTVTANRGILLLQGNVLFPVAQRQLVRAYVSTGDDKNAGRVQDVLNQLWATADPQIARK